MAWRRTSSIRCGAVLAAVLLFGTGCGTDEAPKANQLPTSTRVPGGASIGTKVEQSGSTTLSAPTASSTTTTTAVAGADPGLTVPTTGPSASPTDPQSPSSTAADATIPTRSTVAPGTSRPGSSRPPSTTTPQPLSATCLAAAQVAASGGALRSAPPAEIRPRFEDVAARLQALVDIYNATPNDPVIQLNQAATNALAQVRERTDPREVQTLVERFVATNGLVISDATDRMKLLCPSL